MSYPTSSSASDVWSLRDVYKAEAGNDWPFPPPTAPDTVTAEAGDTEATVTFSGQVTYGDSPSFTVTSSPEGITATGASSPITVTGLTNDTEYTFTVTVTDDGGSATSSASNAVTPEGVPALPAGTVLYISGDNGLVDDGPNGYTITNAGGASIETNEVKVGTQSIRFDGEDNGFIYAGSQTFLNDSLSSWQFQCWARNIGSIPTTSDTGQLIDQYDGADGRMIFGFQSDAIEYRVNGGTVYLSSGAIISGDTWYHVCLNWDGTTHRLFIDGDLKDSTTTAPAVYTGKRTEFGGGGDLSRYDLNGYMDDILIQHNTTVYTANFTPNTTGYV